MPSNPRVLNKHLDEIPAGAVYIGRPSKWGNPIKITATCTREQAVASFERYLQQRPDLIEAARKELAGRDLVCFCRPKLCHGDVWLRVANSENDMSSTLFKSVKSGAKADKLLLMKTTYMTAKAAYYNEGNSVLTDAEFDQLEDRIRELDPDWAELKKTGVKLGKKVEVALDAFCPSLDKLVAEKPIPVERWVRNTSAKHGPRFHVSAKLDGSSIQSTYINGKLTRVRTRGDGTTGKDISFLKDHLDLPKTITTTLKKVVLRHEAIMPVQVYQKKWAGKYDTARAMSAALLNRQDAAPALKDLHFVVVSVQVPNSGVVNLAEVKSWGFRTVQGRAVNAEDLTVENLTDAVAYFKSGPYEADGVVVQVLAEGLPRSADKPEHARAFKVNDAADAFTTRIQSVTWHPSSFGVLVPKALIEPVRIGGALVKQATIYNAKWAMDRGVGPGAVVKVLRAGDIIPKVIEVVTPAPFKLPKKSEFGSWSWDGTMIVLDKTEGEENSQVVARRFARFFSKLKLDQLSIGVAKKLVEAGYTDTAEVFLMNEADFRALPGVKGRAAEYAEQLRVVRAGTDIVTLMGASCAFDRGVGSTRLRTLQAAEPRFLLRSAINRPELKKRVGMVAGCGPAFAELYVRGLPEFYKWMDKTGAKVALPAEASKPKSAKLAGKSFSWTTYRSKDEEQTVNSLSGAVVPFGRKTDVLFFSPTGKPSTKLDKAREMGIEVTTFADYMKKVSK